MFRLYLYEYMIDGDKKLRMCSTVKEECYKDKKENQCTTKKKNRLEAEDLDMI